MAGKKALEIKIVEKNLPGNQAMLNYCIQLLLIYEKKRKSFGLYPEKNLS